MTDQAPERIWIKPADWSANDFMGSFTGGWQVSKPLTSGPHREYVRADLAPRLAKHQPCGCIICTCESDEQCSGCGAKSCGNHPVGEVPNPVYEPRADLAPKVKPLVWRPRNFPNQRGMVWDALYPNPDYTIYRIESPEEGIYYLDDTIGGTVGDYRYGTLEAAQADAQADYERRILSALEGGEAPHLKNKEGE